MRNKNDIIQKIKLALESEKEVVFAYLFGSSVHVPHADSDIDIAVFVESGDIKTLLATEKELDAALASLYPKWCVDLVIINTTPVVIQFKAIAEGKVIFCRDEQKRVDYETAALYRYFDLKPYLDEEKRLILEKLKRTG